LHHIAFIPAEDMLGGLDRDRERLARRGCVEVAVVTLLKREIVIIESKLIALLHAQKEASTEADAGA
jgi:hypothetical protein